jgi:hypothetical protein
MAQGTRKEIIAEIMNWSATWGSPLSREQAEAKAELGGHDSNQDHLRSRCFRPIIAESPKFPANREINREICTFLPFCAIFAPSRSADSRACRQIPYVTEQGIF